jgi:hypothetical protein
MNKAVGSLELSARAVRPPLGQNQRENCTPTVLSRLAKDEQIWLDCS